MTLSEIFEPFQFIFIDNISKIRFLLFIIFFIVIFSTLAKSKVISKDKKIIGLIALAISLISAYRIREEYLQIISDTYKTLSIILILTLVLIILTLIIYQSRTPSPLRQLFLSLFGFFIIYSWYNHYDRFQSNSDYIFLGISMIILIMVISDKKINKLMNKSSRKTIKIKRTH